MLATRHAPYTDDSTNRIYNLLFCDEPQAYAPRRHDMASPWQRTLYAPRTDAGAVRVLAEDAGGESRVRALAFQWLQRHGHAIPGRRLLGVIVEIPLGDGLDVLAAYTDGSVRYIHGSGRMTIVDGALPALQGEVQRLLDSAREVVDHIGIAPAPRPAPPQRNVRLTFVVSDGLYHCEAPLRALMDDTLTNPIVDAATALLRRVVELVAR